MGTTGGLATDTLTGIALVIVAIGKLAISLAKAYAITKKLTTKVSYSIVFLVHD